MTRTLCFRLLNLLLMTAVTAATPALAGAQEGVEDLGVFKDWSARKFEEKGKPVCTMFSQPINSEGNYDKRGEVFAFVTHRPSANRINEVSITIGYTFKKETPVLLRIHSAEFELFSEDGYAWAQDGNADERIVRAMRAGSTMVVEGVSSRGTKTADTFSLSGFSAAHNRITEVCRAR